MIATMSVLAATPKTFDALLRHLPEPLTQMSEGEGTWTIVQVLAHLIHSERTNWLPRLRLLLQEGESAPFPTFQREGNGGESRPLSELLSDFAELRTASLAQLKSLHLTPRDLERCGRHPAFGQVTLSQMLAAWYVHDLSHLHQVSRILASQYCEAVGPWRRYLGVLHCDGHSKKD